MRISIPVPQLGQRCTGSRNTLARGPHSEQAGSRLVIGFDSSFRQSSSLAFRKRLVRNPKWRMR